MTGNYFSRHDHNGKREMLIGDRHIGNKSPVYIIAEMSANHNQDYDLAVEIIKKAKECEADAIKLQTFSPEGLTINCDNEYFTIKGLPLWEGRNLYDLYRESSMPWEWQKKLFAISKDLGLDCFSSPAGRGAVKFLEELNVPAYKIGASDIVDIQLLEEICATRKPIFLSTGMSTMSELEYAVNFIKEAGIEQIALLKCTSSYPAEPEQLNLRTIPHLAETFNCTVGLSDHTLGFDVPIAAVTLGAKIIEKHFTLSRKTQTLDSDFSMEPAEFKEMVKAIRRVEKSFGKATYEPSAKEKETRKYRWSIFVVEDIKSGQRFTKENIRSIRPGFGMSSRYLQIIYGRKALREIKRGTPLNWTDIE